MEIVIKLPDTDITENIIRAAEWEDGSLFDIVLRNAMKDATILPKGHGRILDEKDILDTKNNDGGWYDLVDMPEYIAGVKAIIEADKESEGEE